MSRSGTTAYRAVKQIDLGPILGLIGYNKRLETILVFLYSRLSPKSRIHYFEYTFLNTNSMNDALSNRLNSTVEMTSFYIAIEYLEAVEL